MHWEVNGTGQGHNVNPTNKLMSISYRKSNGNMSAERCAHKQEGTVNSKMRGTTLQTHQEQLQTWRDGISTPQHSCPIVRRSAKG